MSNRYFLKFSRAIDLLDEIDEIRSRKDFKSGDDVDPIIKLMDEIQPDKELLKDILIVLRNINSD